MILHDNKNQDWLKIPISAEYAIIRSNISKGYIAATLSAEMYILSKSIVLLVTLSKKEKYHLGKAIDHMNPLLFELIKF
jgi:hypothetical protein